MKRIAAAVAIVAVLAIVLPAQAQEEVATHGAPCKEIWAPTLIGDTYTFFYADCHYPRKQNKEAIVHAIHGFVVADGETYKNMTLTEILHVGGHVRTAYRSLAHGGLKGMYPARYWRSRSGCLPDCE